MILWRWHSFGSIKSWSSISSESMQVGFSLMNYELSLEWSEVDVGLTSYENLIMNCLWSDLKWLLEWSDLLRTFASWCTGNWMVFKKMSAPHTPSVKQLVVIAQVIFAGYWLVPDLDILGKVLLNGVDCVGERYMFFYPNRFGFEFFLTSWVIYRATVAGTCLLVFPKERWYGWLFLWLEHACLF